MNGLRLNGRFLWAGLVACVATAIWGSLAFVCSVLRLPHDWAHLCSRIWARWILWASGVRVEIRGLENLPTTPAVLVANHQGIFDILAVLGHFPRPPVFVAKHTIFKVPVLGQAMAAVGHIPVNRGDSAEAIASINRGGERLRANRDQVVFFPEGTRTRDGQMKPFKKGAFIFALQTGLPLVPFAIEGSYQALPPEQFRIVPGIMSVQILPEISHTDMDLDDKDQLMALAEAQISTAVTRLQQREALASGKLESKR